MLRSRDPSVRYLALRDLLGKSEDSREVVAARRRVLRGPRLRALLSGQLPDGSFGVHQYKKWGGGHWRIVSAVELGVPAGNREWVRAARQVLSGGYLANLRPRNVAGLYRCHASEPGNAVGACSRLGLAGDPRVERLALGLVEWQWPDGGWNCDASKEARHSSFYESLATLWGLTQYRKATGDKGVGKAVQRASEFFLRHRLFRSCRGEAIVNPGWLKLHYPVYWHYDILQALTVIHLADRLDDPRTKDALDVLQSKRSGGGTWEAEGYYWRLGNRGAGAEVVDWGRGGPNEMITLNALRVLAASGRVQLAETEEGSTTAPGPVASSPSPHRELLPKKRK